MAKYIERDAFIAWLRKIPMVDLSDGRGLCRVIMEDDFKKAIKNMPESIIHDSGVEVVRCKDCVSHNLCKFEQYLGLDGFCSYGGSK